MVAGRTFFLICIPSLVPALDLDFGTYPRPIGTPRLGDIVPEVTLPIMVPDSSTMSYP